MKSTAKQIRQLVLEKHRNVCNRCGFSDIRALQVDHVFGGGSKEVRELGSMAMYVKALADKEGQYQVLCANCNTIKYVEMEQRKEEAEQLKQRSANFKIEILNKMPKFFTTAQLKKVVENSNPNKINRLLRLWATNHLIQKLAHGEWIKLAPLAVSSANAHVQSSVLPRVTPIS
jgi:hypothetical protein